MVRSSYPRESPVEHLKMKRSQSSSCLKKSKLANDFIYVDSLVAMSLLTSGESNKARENCKKASAVRIAQKRHLVKYNRRSSSSPPEQRRKVHKSTHCDDTYVSIDLLNKQIEAMQKNDSPIYVSSTDYVHLDRTRSQSKWNVASKTPKRKKFIGVCKRAKTFVGKMKPDNKKRMLAKNVKNNLGAMELIEKQIFEAGIRMNARIPEQKVEKKQEEVVNVTSNFSVDELQQVMKKNQVFVLDIDVQNVKKVKSCCKMSDLSSKNLFKNARSDVFRRPEQQGLLKSSLKSSLMSEKTSQEFRAFLRSEYSEENFDFWRTCENYSKISSSPLRRQKSRVIFEEFLAKNAPREINVDSNIRRMVEMNLHYPDKDLFTEAQRSIYNLMEKDSYRRFMNHKRHSQI